MRVRTFLIGSGLVAIGVAIGLSAPSLKAQAPASAQCVAAWDVTIGPERSGSGGSGGWHAVKWNRCTGEAIVFSTENHRLDDKSAWRKLDIKP